MVEFLQGTNKKVLSGSNLYPFRVIKEVYCIDIRNSFLDKKISKLHQNFWRSLMIPRGWCIKFATHKWPLQLTKVHFMTISSRFFAYYFDIFHKTEVQTVILKWWTGLNLNWLKSYDTNRKYFHFNPSRKFNAPLYMFAYTFPKLYVHNKIQSFEILKFHNWPLEWVC